MQSYKELGLGLQEKHLFRADHVGTELAFLSVAASKMTQAETDEEREAVRAVFVRFLEKDVLVWMPEFFDKVAADPRASFYGAAAVVAKQFLAMDASALGLTPQEG
jgi:TorA maturation chaperone TorD